MFKKLQITLVLSLVVLLSSFTSKTNENKTTTATITLGQLKAALKSPTGKAYFFTDRKYYRQNLSLDKLEKSAVINGNFKGLVNNVDAALLHTNGKGYFFKGSKYYRYNFYTNKVDKTALISTNWKGVPNNVDAAVVHSNGKAYFFKGDTYYRYNSASRKVDKKALISANWKGVPNNVDAALRHTNGKVYFFKGNTYYRYSITARKVDKVGTVGKDGWKGLSFSNATQVTSNSTSSSKNNIRLKVTLTRIKSIQARDSDDIADFIIGQRVYYRTNGKPKVSIDGKTRVGEIIIDNEYSTIIQNFTNYKDEKHLHVREGDENHFINNSLVYEITPQEIKDKRAKFNFHTNLGEIDGDSWFFRNIAMLFEENDIKKIAKNHHIDVNIYEVLDYLQNPKAAKYGKSYFNGGRSGKMHEYGAYGDVMWMQKGSNNSLIGHLEFGDNSKETYVRLYYRFELIP